MSRPSPALSPTVRAPSPAAAPVSHRPTREWISCCPAVRNPSTDCLGSIDHHVQAIKTDVAAATAFDHAGDLPRLAGSAAAGTGSGQAQPAVRHRRCPIEIGHDQWQVRLRRPPSLPRHSAGCRRRSEGARTPPGRLAGRVTTAAITVERCIPGFGTLSVKRIDQAVLIIFRPPLTHLDVAVRTGAITDRSQYFSSGIYRGIIGTCSCLPGRPKW